MDVEEKKMGALLQLDRFLRPVIRSLVSEEEALTAIDKVVENADGLAPGEDLRSAVSRAGLLGVATPAHFGGADVTNATLAEIVNRCATASPQDAVRLVSHFTANEIVRNAIGNAQTIFQRVAAGARLVAVVANGTDGFVLKASGDDAPHAVAEGEDIWFVVLRSAEAGPVSVHITRTLQTSRDVLDGSLLEIDASVWPLVRSVNNLLQAGAFVGAVERSRRGQLPDGVAEALMITFETVSALIARVGAAIDLAQISPSAVNIAEAARLADVLQTVQERFAAEHPALDAFR